MASRRSPSWTSRRLTSCWPTSACRDETATRWPSTSSRRLGWRTSRSCCSPVRSSPSTRTRPPRSVCDGVLAKPFEPQQVIGRVKELLAKPKHASSAIDERGSVLPPPPSPWTVPLVDLPLAGRAVSEPEASGVDNYFNRLDQAFADVAGGEPPQTVRPSAPDTGERDERRVFIAAAPCPVCRPRSRADVVRCRLLRFRTGRLR